MLRPIYLALICLSFIGVLIAVRTTIAARAVSEPKLAPDTRAISETDDRPPLAKGDKLPSADLELVKKKVSVVPIEVAPAETKTPTSSKVEEVTSWHWHVGSKVSKRTVPRER